MIRVSNSATCMAGALAVMIACAACGANPDPEKDEAAAFVAQSAEEIEEQAVLAMRALKSVRFAGTIVTDGESVKLDLAISTGGDCVGSMEMESAEIEVLVVDGVQYLKGDEKFWVMSLDAERGPEMSRLVGDRWVQLPAEAGDFKEFCDLDELLDEMESDDSATVTKGAPGEVDGRSAISLVSEEEDGKSLAWIATEGDHLLLKLEGIEGEEGSIVFTNFDEPVRAEAPPADEVADLSALG